MSSKKSYFYGLVLPNAEEECNKAGVGFAPEMCSFIGKVRKFESEGRILGNCYGEHAELDGEDGEYSWVKSCVVKVNMTAAQYLAYRGVKPVVLPKEVEEVLGKSKYKSDKDVRNLLLAVDKVYSRKKKH